MTAEELLTKYADDDLTISREAVISAMIEFAGLKATEALEAAAGNVEFDEGVLIRQSILQSYPLNLIK